MEIGIDQDQDMARGFRVSKDGIVLITRDMLSQRAPKMEILQQTKPIKMSA